MKKILLYKTENIYIQIFRSLIVGVICLIADMSVLIFLTEFFSIHYLVSATAGFTVGIITNYLLSSFWVFSKSELTNKWLERILFVAFGIIGLGLNDVFMFLFTDITHFHYIYSKLLATVLVFCWNFASRKIFLFK